MSSSALVSLGEYLATMYHPDCDYVDGELLERNMGEKDHGGVQTALAAWLYLRRKQLGISVYTETQIRIRESRYRIPDLCVFVGPAPDEPVFSTSPFLCIEILSPDDRMSRFQQRIDDYLAMGVRFVWVVDPAVRRGWVYTSDSIREAKDGVLRTTDPAIAVPIAELFD